MDTKFLKTKNGYIITKKETKNGYIITKIYTEPPQK